MNTLFSISGLPPWPAVLQCVASDCDYWPPLAAADPSLVVSAGLPDTCWMWRAESALTRAKARDLGLREDPDRLAVGR